MRHVIWFVSALVSAQMISGAAGLKIVPTQSHDIWDRAAGFPGGYVHSIVQTPDGYLWIATSKGLVRYDGLSFAFIAQGYAGADAKSPIIGLVADSSGALWAADDRDHLFRYTNNRLQGPLPDKARHRYGAGAVNITPDGWLLRATEDQGMVEYQHGKAKVVLDPNITLYSPTAVAQTADGTFWIGTRERGLFRVNANHGAPEVKQITGMPSARINCLLSIGHSSLLIGTDKGLLSLSEGKLNQVVHPALGDHEVLALAKGQDGDVWIGSSNRLFKAGAKHLYADGRIDLLDDLPVHFPIASLFEDRAGDLWIGGAEVIERYRTNGFTSYLSSAGLPCRDCGAICSDETRDLWLSPSDGGLFRLTKGTVQKVSVEGLSNDTVYSIAGGAGDVWVARKNAGVTRFQSRGDKLFSTTYARQNGQAANGVFSIYRAPDGTVWAGTLGEGISYFQGGRWRTFTIRDGLPSNTASVITTNGRGGVFAGTSNGLAEFTSNHWITYSVHDGLPPGQIESLLLDHTGTLWIGTAKGIAFLSSGTIHVPVTAPEPLFGDILGIAESNGWLWITTGNHVLRVKSSALLNNSFGAGDYREFAVSDGLPSVEGVKRSRSVVVDDQGEVWLSLNQGISVLRPQAFARPALPVTSRVDGLLIDGRPVETAGPIQVPAGRRRLTFRYAGVNVSTPETVRYRYRLDNVDSAWSEPTDLREVDYTNIPPGQFRFHVMARDSDGRWSGQEAGLSFEVESEYWQTRWFQITSAAGLVLLAWILYRLRLRQMALRMDLRYTERLAERTRIARDLHDTLLQSFQGLLLRFQSVSNLLPHRADEAKQRLDGAIDQASQAIAEGRDAVHDLRLSAALGNDLATAIAALAEEFSVDIGKGNCPDFRVEVEGAPRELNPILRDEVYRIATEALRNAWRHSGARRIEAEIRYDEGQFRLRIRDNGKGIDPTALDGAGLPGHWGLSGMRERAKLVGGTLEVWSKSGSGTEVELTIPAANAYGTARTLRQSFSSRK